MRSGRLCLLVAFAACAGSHHRGPPYRPVHGGECPEDRGCELLVDEQPRFQHPDVSERFPLQPDTVEALLAARAPEPTCARVGGAVASLELGNYAEAEVLAPIATRYEASCRRHRLDEAERTCVIEAPDRWNMAYCAPRLLPDVPLQLVDASECSAIARQIRERMGALPAGRVGDRTWEGRMRALDASCREDRWPLAFGQCARTSPMAAYPTPCMNVAPPALQRKLEARFAAQLTTERVK